MTKKFLVQIAFVVEETDEIPNEDKLQYFIRKNGGIFFSGDEHDENNISITDVFLSGNQLILGVTELD